MHKDVCQVEKCHATLAVSLQPLGSASSCSPYGGCTALRVLVAPSSACAGGGMYVPLHEPQASSATLRPLCQASMFHHQPDG